MKTKEARKKLSEQVKMLKNKFFLREIFGEQKNQNNYPISHDLVKMENNKLVRHDKVLRTLCIQF